MSKWEKVRLKEVCDFQGGSQPPKEEWVNDYTDGYIRMLQIRDFTQEREGKEEYIKISSNIKTCDSTDVMIARYGASVGKILTGLSGAYNVAIMKTIPDTGKLMKVYLRYFLLSSIFQNFIRNVGSRAAQAGFNKNDLDNLQIPLPPLEVQKKIAQSLDAASELIALRKKQLAELDNLIKSVLYDMFGDPVTNEKGWELYCVGDFAKVETGSTPLRSNNSYYDNGTIPWVKTGEINGSYIYSAEESITDKAVDETNCKLLPANTILVAMYGQGKTRGKVGLLKIKATTNQACAAILPNGKFSSEYLLRTLDFCYQELRDLGRGGNQPNLNLSIVKNFTIPLPPIDLQIRFAEIVTKIEEQKALVQKAIDESQYLFDSLMNEYFE